MSNSSVIPLVGERAFKFVQESLKSDSEPYHNIKYITSLVKRVKKIAGAVDLSLREISLVEIAAAFHCSVCAFEITLNQDHSTYFQTRRLAADSKMKSADLAVEWMSKQVQEKFSAEERSLVRGAILATYLSYSEKDSEKDKTLVQNQLSPGSHKVTRVLALAELGCAGMEPENFLEDVDRRFLEHNVDFFVAIKNSLAVIESLQHLILERYLEYLDSNLEFVQGRKILFETELGNLNLVEKSCLRSLFSGFDKSSRALDEWCMIAKGFSFIELVNHLRQFL